MGAYVCVNSFDHTYAPAQIVLAQPWSTPTRSEAMMLIMALLAGTMVASALFHDTYISDASLFVEVSIASTLISRVPP